MRLSLPFLRVWNRDRGAVPGETPSGRARVAGTEPGALIAVARRKEATHKLVALPDVLRLTGLLPDEVLQRPDTQHLVSIDASGTRTEFVQVPIALLGVEAEGVNALSEREQVVVRAGSAGAVVHLSQRECWELYVLLDDDAPFVRHQLSVVRHGGRGGVSLTTAAERRQVLDRLLSSAAGELPDGLGLLRATLAEALGDEGPDEVVGG